MSADVAGRLSGDPACRGNPELNLLWIMQGEQVLAWAHLQEKGETDEYLRREGYVRVWERFPVLDPSDIDIEDFDALWVR